MHHGWRAQRLLSSFGSVRPALTVTTMDRSDLSREDDALLRAAGMRWPQVKELVIAGCPVSDAITLHTAMVAAAMGGSVLDDRATAVNALTAGISSTLLVRLPVGLWGVLTRALRWSDHKSSMGSWSGADIDQLTVAFLDETFPRPLDSLLAALPDLVLVTATVEDALTVSRSASSMDLSEVTRLMRAGMTLEDIEWVCRHVPGGDLPSKGEVAKVLVLTDPHERRLALALLAASNVGSDGAMAIAAALPHGHEEAARLVLDGWDVHEAVRAARALGPSERSRVRVSSPVDKGRSADVGF